jgi:predicted small secreted protein
MKKLILTFIVISALGLPLAGCGNTLEGLGRDIQDVGETLQGR